MVLRNAGKLGKSDGPLTLGNDNLGVVDEETGISPSITVKSTKRYVFHWDLWNKLSKSHWIDVWWNSSGQQSPYNLVIKHCHQALGRQNIHIGNTPREACREEPVKSSRRLASFPQVLTPHKWCGVHRRRGAKLRHHPPGGIFYDESPMHSPERASAKATEPPHERGGWKFPWIGYGYGGFLK